MTLGGVAAQKLALRKKNVQLAAAFPNGVRCQKCLEFGHWSYECKGKRKFLHRSSRTKQLNKNLEKKRLKELTSTEPKSNNKRQKLADKACESTTSSSSDSSSDSDSSTDSSDSSEGSDSDSPSSSSSSDDDSSLNDGYTGSDSEGEA